MGRTCRRAGEIELTPIWPPFGAELNGLGRVLVGVVVVQFATHGGERAQVVAEVLAHARPRPQPGRAVADLVAWARSRAVIIFGWVFFLIPSGGQAPHVLRAQMGVHRTCGEPDEIGLTPMGVKLNGSRGVQTAKCCILQKAPTVYAAPTTLRKPQCWHVTHTYLLTKGTIFRVGLFLDFVWLTTRTPHGAYVRGARRNRIDPRGGGIERIGTRTRGGGRWRCRSGPSGGYSPRGYRPRGAPRGWPAAAHRATPPRTCSPRHAPEHRVSAPHHAKTQGKSRSRCTVARGRARTPPCPRARPSRRPQKARRSQRRRRRPCRRGVVAAAGACRSAARRGCPWRGPSARCGRSAG